MNIVKRNSFIILIASIILLFTVLCININFEYMANDVVDFKNLDQIDESLNYKIKEIEDFYNHQNEILFSIKKSQKETKEELLKIIKKQGNENENNCSINGKT